MERCKILIFTSNFTLLWRGHLRAGATFPVPVCTVPSSMDRTNRCNKVDAARLYASYRLNLLLLKRQRSGTKYLTIWFDFIWLVLILRTRKRKFNLSGNKLEIYNIFVLLKISSVREGLMSTYKILILREIYFSLTCLKYVRCIYTFIYI